MTFDIIDIKKTNSIIMSCNIRLLIKSILDNKGMSSLFYEYYNYLYDEDLWLNKIKSYRHIGEHSILYVIQPSISGRYNEKNICNLLTTHNELYYFIDEDNWYSRKMSEENNYVDCLIGVKKDNIISQVILYCNDVWKSEYVFKVKTDLLYAFIFSLWSYFSSIDKNKRQSFKSNLLSEFGMVNFEKSHESIYFPGLWEFRYQYARKESIKHYGCPNAKLLSNVIDQESLFGEKSINNILSYLFGLKLFKYEELTNETMLKFCQDNTIDYKFEDHNWDFINSFYTMNFTKNQIIKINNLILDYLRWNFNKGRNHYTYCLVPNNSSVDITKEYNQLLYDLKFQNKKLLKAYSYSKYSNRIYNRFVDKNKDFIYGISIEKKSDGTQYVRIGISSPQIKSKNFTNSEYEREINYTPVDSDDLLPIDIINHPLGIKELKYHNFDGEKLKTYLNKEDRIFHHGNAEYDAIIEVNYPSKRLLGRKITSFSCFKSKNGDCCIIYNINGYNDPHNLLSEEKEYIRILCFLFNKIGININIDFPSESKVLKSVFNQNDVIYTLRVYNRKNHCDYELSIDIKSKL